MKRFFASIGKFALAIYLLAIHLCAALYLYQNYFDRAPLEITEVNLPVPIETLPVPTVLPIPSIEPDVDANSNQTADANQTNGANPTPNANQTANNFVSDAAPDVLMIPVVGVRREQLQDTFNDARSEGRVHNAIDIMAPGGTPIVAVADGEIAKFFESERGGITIYQFSSDRRFVYYYAHLQKRADNLKEKDFVRRGTIIGYVGDTGDAGAGNFHLHFSISIPENPQKYWGGTDINPYPILKAGIEAR